jgi:hypothetical protein
VQRKPSKPTCSFIRYKDKDGKEKVLKEQHQLPPDVANGLLFTLVKHIQPKVPRTTVSTGAALVALILTFGSISGAHFNPAVSLADAIEGGLTWSDFVLCLLEENQDDSHNQVPAWCFAPSARQVFDGPVRVHQP